MSTLKIAHAAPVTDLLKEDWYSSIRAGGAVKRCHVISIIGENLVATHSWGVALLVHRLWPDASKDLLLAALTHDVPEKWIGDVPADAKWRNPRIRAELKAAEEMVVAELGLDFDLSEVEKFRLSVADRMELMWFCLEQRRLGNRNVDIVFGRLHDWLIQQDPERLGFPALRMINELVDAYNEVSK